MSPLASTGFNAPLPSMPMPTPPKSADRGPKSGFDAAVRGAMARGPAEPGGVRAAAEQMVASAFLLPLMAEARGGSLKSNLFGGGFAQDAMAQQLETRIADAVVKGARFPVVDRMVADATRRAVRP